MVLYYPPTKQDYPTAPTKKRLTHLDLPESDGTFVKNLHEHPQAVLLTEILQPVLDARHPDGRYCIGQDSGIYWDQIISALAVLAPDWFYVPDVAKMPAGEYRRSYVLWEEQVSPMLVVEFVSGSSKEERDTTPMTGKFWIYEQKIRANYYAIYEVKRALVDVYCLVHGRYQRVVPNSRGHLPIASMGIELGIWTGIYRNQEMPWLRAWDRQGNLLLTGDERIEQERHAKEQERHAKEQERYAKEQALAQLAQLQARLQEMGIDPDAL